MPRKPRYYAAGVPCHVITRGNDRRACFFSVQDYQLYLECLSSACQRYHVALHAYVLMSNHVHLLMTPECKEGISRVMQSIGRRYVQTINTRYKRTGTLCEGRHKASVIDHERYLLICHKYIELNPVRANMVKHPKDYRWSSYRENTGLVETQLLTPHDLYQQLGYCKESRAKSYKALFEDNLSDRDLSDIRTAGVLSAPLGDSTFQAEIEKVTARDPRY